MNTNSSRGNEEITRDPLSNNLEGKSTIPNDLPDSPQDLEKLRGEETTIDLPDVKDIPGQEFVNAPSLGELADTTISSAGEEGDGVFDEEGDEKGTDFNVRPDERQVLENMDKASSLDENNLQRASMDSVDFQGEPLNEKGFGEITGDTVAGDDLDTGDDEDETTSTIKNTEDEENDYYSLGGDDNEDTVEPAQ